MRPPLLLSAFACVIVSRKRRTRAIHDFPATPAATNVARGAILLHGARGEYYSIPFESWDATRGGYVNFKRPTELFQRVEPGE